MVQQHPVQGQEDWRHFQNCISGYIRFFQHHLLVKDHPTCPVCLPALSTHLPCLPTCPVCPPALSAHMPCQTTINVLLNSFQHHLLVKDHVHSQNLLHSHLIIIDWLKVHITFLVGMSVLLVATAKYCHIYWLSLTARSSPSSFLVYLPCLCPLLSILFCWSGLLPK